MKSKFIFILLIIFCFLTVTTKYIWWPKENNYHSTMKELKDTKLLNGWENRLSQFIQFKTVSAKIESSDYQIEFKKQDDFLKKNYPLSFQNTFHKRVGDWSLVFKLDGSDKNLKPILLLAHLDVVNVIEENWNHPPFGGHIENDRLYGRGSIDDKSSALAILESLEACLSNKMVPNRTIFIAFGSDEEVGGVNGAKLISEYFQKQNLEFDFIIDEGGFLTDGQSFGFENKVALIGIAEKGYLDLTLKATSDGGHSSLPQGPSSIEKLSYAINEIQKNKPKATIEGAFGETLKFISKNSNGLKKWALNNLWLTSPFLIKKFENNFKTNALMRTTQVTTMIEGGFQVNVLPPNAIANINLRLHTNDSIEQTIGRIKRQINDESIEVYENKDSILSEPSQISSTDNHAFKFLEELIFKIDTQTDTLPILLTGATDSRYYRSLTNNIYRFTYNYIKSDDLKMIHGDNESVSLFDYQNSVLFYTNIMLQY